MKNADFLKVEGVTVRFETRERTINALDDVTVSFSKSDRVAIVGESGAGKTTLARCLLGLTRPASGRILFNGKDIVKASKKEKIMFRKSVQAVFQDPYDAMNPKQNVFDYISMPLKFIVGNLSRGEQVTRCEQLLASVGLDESLLMKYPHQLSGGQKQRVAIAKALACDPEFLIADEPTSMLDASAAAGILNLLKRLADENNMGYAIVTHNMGVASYTAEKICVMYSGKIVEERATESLLSSPLHPYSRVLLMHAPKSLTLMLSGRTANNALVAGSESVGDTGVDSWLLSGCRYRDRCERRIAQCEDVFPPLEEVGNNGKVACYNPLVDSSVKKPES